MAIKMYKIKKTVPTIAIIICAIYIAIGCENTKTPFAADPVQPPSGKLNVYVTDNETPIPNLTIKAVDPTGNNFTTITDSTGMAILNPLPFNFGIWNVQVPTQGKYYNSNMNVVMSTTIQSETVTFHADPPILTLDAINGNYPYGGGAVTYSVGFQTGGNLNSQEILSIPTNNFPSTMWAQYFSPSLLGDPSGNTLSQLIVKIPNCSYQQPAFRVVASDPTGVISALSNAITVNRSYKINSTLSMGNHARYCSQPNGLGGCAEWTESWNVDFSTTNDCEVPWNITISYNLFSVNNWSLKFPDGSNTGQMNSGISYTITGVKSGFSFILNYAYTTEKNPVGNSAVSSVIGSGSNSGTVNASWDF